MIFSSSDRASAHFYERMLERFNIWATPGVAQQISKMIDTADEDCDLLEDWDFPICRFKVKYCFTDYIVVYNVMEKVLVTVFPANSPEPVPSKHEDLPTAKSPKVGQLKKKRKLLDENAKLTKHKAKLFEVNEDGED